MNITMNSAALPASADTNLPVGAAAPAEGLPADPLLAGAPAAAPAPLAFLQFMELDVAAPAPQAAAPALPEALLELLPDAPRDAALPAGDAVPADEAQAAPDQPLAAAMAMPLMPSMMMALPAALPASVRLAAGMPEQEHAEQAAPVAAAGLPAGVAVRSAAPADAVRQALAQAALPARDADAAARAEPARAGVQPVAAAVQAPGQALQQSQQQSSHQASHQAAAPQAADAAADGQSPNTFGVPAPAAPAAPARDSATLALSGPPTAWRESLQNALGERLQLQLGKNAEQAVIRLEPPMLGRVEIAIRHAAGSLEVNITATHGEVLRQLNSVSENLRNDLAGRQYADVSVTVTQAPRAQAAAQAGAGFGADAQGRGRQQEQQQESRPGSALADAHQPDTAFSLSGRA